MSNAANNLSSLPGIAAHHSMLLTVVSMSLNSILSLPLNSYVLWLILRGASGTLASDFFSLNLAMSELISSLCVIFYALYMRTEILLLFEVFIFSMGLILTHRPLLQCCICVECYFGVVHPVFFLRYKHLRYKVPICSVAALITLASCFYCKHTYSQPLYLYGYFIQNLLFFFVMLFCCLAVVITIKRPGPGAKAPERKKSNKMKRKAFKIIMLVMISMGISFLLYVATIPLQCCLKPIHYTAIMNMSMSLALISGFTQPLLYLWRNRKFPCIKSL